MDTEPLPWLAPNAEPVIVTTVPAEPDAGDTWVICGVWDHTKDGLKSINKTSNNPAACLGGMKFIPFSEKFREPIKIVRVGRHTSRDAMKTV